MLFKHKLINGLMVSATVLSLITTSSVANARRHRSHYYHYTFSRVARMPDFRGLPKPELRTLTRIMNQESAKEAQRSARHYRRAHRSYRSRRTYRAHRTSRKHNRRPRHITYRGEQRYLDDQLYLYRTPAAIKGIYFNWTKSHPVNATSKKERRAIINQLKSWELKYVNRDRASKHLPPLRETKTLDEIANQRIPQLEQKVTHYNRKGQVRARLIAKQMGLGENYQGGLAENIQSLEEPSGHNGRHIYTVSGKQVAGDSNYSFWNAERGRTESKDGGHRQNIESPVATEIGISATLNPRNKVYYIAEEFSESLNDYLNYEQDNTEGIPYNAKNNTDLASDYSD